MGKQTDTGADLRAEVLDYLLPLRCAARLWGAELRLDCAADELAAAFPNGRRVTYVAEPADLGGEPYALDGYVVELPGGRVGVRLASRLAMRPATAAERAELGTATATPRIATVEVVA